MSCGLWRELDRAAGDEGDQEGDERRTAERVEGGERGG